MTSTRQEDDAFDLVRLGSDVVGASAGAALGLLGGPAGVLAGAAAGPVVSRALIGAAGEIAARSLAPRQRERMGVVLFLATNEISARIMAGESVREDRFFEADGENRATAAEILEGVLLRAGDCYEEKKLEFLARLQAGIVFDATISPGYAYYLLRTASELTYQQIVFLAQFGPNRPELPYIPPDEQMLKDVRRGGSSIGAELMDLGTRQILVVAAGGQRASLGATLDAQAVVHFRTGLVAPSRVGVDLIRLLRLQSVPQDEIDEQFRRLAGAYEDE